MQQNPSSPARLATAAIPLLLVLATLVAGSASGCSGRSVSIRSQGSHWVRDGDQWKIRVVDPTDDSILIAELKIEKEESNGIASYRLERVELFPPGDPMPRLWRLLSPRSELLTLDGSVLVHPDVGVLKRLGATPQLPAAQAVLADLIHFDSRGEALARVAKGALPRHDFDALVDILARGAAGPIGDPASDQLSSPLGGSARRAAAPALEVLSSRNDFVSEQFDQLTTLVGKIPTRDQRVRFLEKLVGKASIGAIADATAHLPTESERATTARLLADQPDLTDAEIVAICRATTRISSSNRQLEILRPLATRGAIGPILDASSHIGSSRARAEILDLLARRRPLTPAESAAIGNDAVRLSNASDQVEVISALCEVADLDDLLTLAPALLTNSARATILTTLARQPGLSPSDAAKIAATTTSIQNSGDRVRVLEELIGIAPTVAILGGAMSSPSGKAKAYVLEQLALQPNLSESDARAIVDATKRLGSSTDQTHLLGTLIGKAPLTTILEAVAEIDSVSGRTELLLSLCKLPAIEQSEADAIAGAVESVRASSSSTRKVLGALIGVASTPLLIESAKQIPSESTRSELYMALINQPGLTSGEATLLVDAATALPSSAQIDRLLRALIGHAPQPVIRKAAERIPSSSRRNALLKLLDQP